MKKIKVLALMIVFAFAALGGAYAMWYDSLFINENVSTGIVNLTWGCTQSSDPGNNYVGAGGVFKGSLDRLDPGNPNDAKNVGSKNAVLSNDNEYTDCRAVNDVLNITLKNGYPGYQESICASIANIGTVPTKFEVTMADGTAIPDWMDFQIVDLCGNVVFDNGVNTLDGLQIDPGDCVCIKIVERILQEAPQNASACFTLQLKGIQWNEYDFELPNIITADASVQ